MNRNSEIDSDSSEEYFDAEDSTQNRLSNVSCKSLIDCGRLAKEFIFPQPAVKIHASSESDTTPIGTGTSVTNSPNNSLSARCSKPDSNGFVECKILPVAVNYGRQRFQELRQCMQNDEDENPGNTLTPDSQNSSMDGMFANRPTHPFKIVESDKMSVQSMTSLGRVGRILSGSIDPSISSLDKESLQSGGNILTNNATNVIAPVAMDREVFNIYPNSIDIQSSNSNTKAAVATATITTTTTTTTTAAATAKVILQEPDVIASTKLAHSKTTDSITATGPIAPPRRKKRLRKFSSASEQLKLSDNMLLPAFDTDTDSDTKSVQSVYNAHNKFGEKKWTESSPKSSPKSSQLPLSANLAKPAAIFDVNIANFNTSTSIEISLANTMVSSKIIALGGSCKHLPQSAVVSNNASRPSYCNTSPSSVVKNNSKTTIRSINPNQGLHLHRAIHGGYVVQPCDNELNKAEGATQQEIERVERLLSNMQRPKLLSSGSNSLGSNTRYPSMVQRTNNEKERRKSAGDEDVLRQMNIYVRTRTNSGKQLSDFEILEQVPVKNLDTGENMPLSKVHPPPVPDGWNPLSLHILKLTSHLEVNQKESDDESVIGIPPINDGQPQDEEECETEDGSRLKRKTAKIKRFFGSTVRKTVDKAKSFASEVSHARHKEDVADIVDAMNPEQNIKIKASSTNKGPYEFTKLQHVQDLSGEHTGAVWCMKFSSCGRLLATAGQDKLLRIWVLKDAYPFFRDVRKKYDAEQKSSPTPSQESLVTHNSIDDSVDMTAIAEECTGPFMPKSFCSYVGHTSDLLDVSWSKNYFILSSSMDKTVRLWHISRRECLCCFQHIDFVTAIAFHPRDDRYFLSGSLDGKLRLWNIPDKKVALWNELDGQTKLITAANFCQNGQFAVVGSYDGRCIFYNTDQLKYHTSIHVRSTRGKNRIGRKISGIEPMPGEDKILVTSNDSRVRLYDLRDLNLSCKYKGYLNASSQIKASFSHDGKYIIAGSENQCIYIWKTNHDYSKLSSVRRDRSDFWEGIKAHNATVTCAIFAPHPEAIIKPETTDEIPNEKELRNQPQPDPLAEQHKKGCGYVMISADFNGAIKIFINKTKPKHSSLPYTAIAD